MVRALARLGDQVHSIWVGDGRLRAEVRQEAETLGVSQRLHLVGFDPNPNRWLVLAKELTDKGELRLAMRALYLATLAHLTE